MSDTTAHHGYYTPQPSPYPALMTAGLFFLLLGFVLRLGALPSGTWVMLIGVLVFAWVMWNWLGAVITESEGGAYRRQEDRSFRWGMIGFITSEVLFFATFFCALYYVRNLSVPWLASYDPRLTIWPGFTAAWPSAGPAGDAVTPMRPWGIPALNTLILLTSGITVTWAHWGLLKNNRAQLVRGLFLTIALGLIFLGFQAYEFYHAYEKMGLTLNSGVYGATFFMLTGFHGFHVTVGVIMLAVIFGRALRGHFKPEHHFGFEAVSWYWHFVDVVWLMLFVFVYWL